MNRRNFLQTSGTATTALLLASLEAIASSQQPNFTMNNTFKLKLLATNWGFPGSLDEYCAKVKKEGYDGIEIWWPLEKKDQDELFESLKKHELEVGFLCAGSDSNYQKHFDQFTQMVDAAAKKPFSGHCILIVIREKIIFPMNRVKHLLIIQSDLQNQPVLKFVMKRIVQDCYIQLRLQNIIWKPFRSCESLLMYHTGAMCMRVYWRISRKQWI